jgi:hypothetical protein
VVTGNLFDYQIFFENETNATAPAQLVQIANPLSTNLDWQTFELTEIAFGDHFIPVPPHSQHFQTTIAVSQNGVSFDVQIEAGINLATGQVFANFFSIDPTTSLPPAVDIGFLPPENGTGRGMGHVSYLIHPRPNLFTGLEIRNVAYIRFDVNPVISTDQVDPHDPSKGTDPNKQALITIDNVAPSSAVNSLAGVSTTANFTVCWSGTDVGSGIIGYDIYAATNSGPWGVWLNQTTNTCAVFEGQEGNSYSFYSVARDGVGLAETPPTTADTATTVQVQQSVLVIISHSPSPGGIDTEVTLSYQVLPGKNYTIEYSDDLGPQTLWQPVPGAPHNSGSVTESVTSSQRFYRLIVE